MKTILMAVIGCLHIASAAAQQPGGNNWGRYSAGVPQAVSPPVAMDLRALELGASRTPAQLGLRAPFAPGWSPYTFRQPPSPGFGVPGLTPSGEINLLLREPPPVGANRAR